MCKFNTGSFSVALCELNIQHTLQLCTNEGILVRSLWYGQLEKLQVRLWNRICRVGEESTVETKRVNERSE